MTNRTSHFASTIVIVIVITIVIIIIVIYNFIVIVIVIVIGSMSSHLASKTASLSWISARADLSLG